MASSRVMALQQKINQSESLINLLRKQLSVLKANSTEAAIKTEEKNLRSENEALAERVKELKCRLISLETANGAVQVPLPSGERSSATPSTRARPPPQQVPSSSGDRSSANLPNAEGPPPPQQQQERKQAKPDASKGKKEGAKAANKGGSGGGGEAVVDASRLDMRIGEIIDVKVHPDADLLYMETVNLGEEKPRTILSGLVEHVPIEQMRNRRAVFLCNMKPVKMRGIFSEGMIMCAGNKDMGIEIIGVPNDAVPGDLVSVEGYPRQPDAQLNPKKKIVERLKPDLRTDADGFATYKSAKWVIPGKGYCRASHVNAPIS